MTEQMETQRQSTFIMAAKSFVGMVRDNNEDNFQIAADLDATPMLWPKNNQLYELGGKGALLVVADGMGGMNAGEVASKIAIDTAKDCFAREKINDEVVKTRYTVERFMNAVITEADNRIKQYAQANPETKGMGTTMVIGWALGQSLYISWAGDSRAYVFNPSYGLKRLSKDHSLVQQLVDSGKISKEDAFDYPDSNVITNCLSAMSQKAEPEALDMPHRLHEGDIILLCSDGLCGLIRDTEIQAVISANQDNMEVCCDTLIKAACDAGGHDNVTVALCKIISLKDNHEYEDNDYSKSEKKWTKWGILLLIAAFLTALAVWKWPSSFHGNEKKTEVQNDQGTLKNEQHSENTTAYIYKQDNDTICYTDKVYATIDKDSLTIHVQDTIKHKMINLPKRSSEGALPDNIVTNYRYKFDPDSLSKNKLDGRFTMDSKNRDTVILKNVPIYNTEEEEQEQKNSKKGDKEISGNGSDNSNHHEKTTPFPGNTNTPQDPQTNKPDDLTPEHPSTDSNH